MHHHVSISSELKKPEAWKLTALGAKFIATRVDTLAVGHAHGHYAADEDDLQDKQILNLDHFAGVFFLCCELEIDLNR